MLANAARVMPDELKFEGDKKFFTAALDRADLIVHGRNSYEDQPNSPQRKRIVLTRRIGAIAPDPTNPKATLWNPAGASFEAACEFRRRAFRHRRDHRRTGRVRDVHGPLRHVLALAGAAGAAARRRTLLPRRARTVSAANSGRTWPDSRRGQILDTADEVSVTPWRRAGSDVAHRPVLAFAGVRPYPAIMNSAPMIDRFFRASIERLCIFGRRSDSRSHDNRTSPRPRRRSQNRKKARAEIQRDHQSANQLRARRPRWQASAAVGMPVIASSCEVYGASNRGNDDLRRKWICGCRGRSQKAWIEPE